MLTRLATRITETLKNYHPLDYTVTTTSNTILKAYLTKTKSPNGAYYCMQLCNKLRKIVHSS